MENTYAQTDLQTEMKSTSLLSWRSILGGLIVGLLAMTTLSALGVALGGAGLDEQSSLKGALTFAGIWTLASIVVSILAGSYFAARLSNYRGAKVGASQGLVVASILLGLMTYQAFSVVGHLGQAAGSAVSGASSILSQGAQAATNSSTVNEIVEDAMGDTNISPDRMQAVATGVATRLVQGNPDSAKNYLAKQAGISPQEADARIAQLKTKVNENLVAAREAAAKGMQATGWTLFVTLLIGAIAGALAGALGATLNIRKPLEVVVADRKLGQLRPASI